MFETAVLSSGPRKKRVWTTFAGFGGQAILITGLVMAPLIWPRTLPNLMHSSWLEAPPVPRGPERPPAPRVEPRRVIATRAMPDNVLRAPSAVPDRVEILVDDAPPADYRTPVGGLLGTDRNVPGPILEAIGRDIPALPVAKPPEPIVAAPPTPTAPTRPPRITELRMAEPVQRVNPPYPALARAARISGKVELMGILGIDGRIHEIKVLSGHPLLVKAAVDAVMQWVYRPTVLNGQAVEVQAPITVNFLLN
jgi:protein TonB